MLRQAAFVFIFGLVGFAHAHPAVGEPFTPALGEFVVGSIAGLTESELMNPLEVLPQLEFGEMFSAESIDVIQSTPDVAVHFGALCRQVFGVSRFKTPELHHVATSGRNYGWRGVFSGSGEREDTIFRPLLAKMPLGFDCHFIGRGLARVLEDQVYRPMLVVSVFGLRSPEQSCFYQHVSAQLPFGGMTPVADLHDDDSDEKQSDDGNGVIKELVQELIDVAPIAFGVICGAIGIAIYLNSRRFFGSLVGMILLAAGVMFPWRALISVMM
jgi:hypothetical protein